MFFSQGKFITSHHAIIKSLDIPLLSQLLILFFIGIALLYSAALGSMEPWALKQLVTIAVFVPVLIIIASLEFRIIYNSAYLAYGVALFLLILVSLFGHRAMGAHRWLRIGVIGIQPSEFMKIGLILALARYYHDQHTTTVKTLRHIVIPLLLTLVPTILILKQPNLGTAIIMLTIATTVLFASGVRWQKFALVGGAALIATPFIWEFMHDYQRQRVLTFLNPDADKLGASYNIIQSIIAIGSGGFFGKGFLQGSQSQLSFLPEKQTDFILSVAGEEFGFLGIIIILALTIGIVVSSYRAAFAAHTHFFRLITIGVTTAFAFHAIINASMIAGLLPVVGMPYPLLSFGGSNLACFLIGFGLILNPKLRRAKS